MLGALAGLRSYPHLVGAETLRIRNGATHDIAIPWEIIAMVTTQNRSLPSAIWALQPQEDDRGTHLNVAVSGRVNVHLLLRKPLHVGARKGDMLVTGLSFWVDEPRDVATRIRRHIESKSPRH
jgi:hypothetical protein